MIPKEMIEAADAIIRERIHSVLQFETAVGYRLLKGTYEIAEAALTAASQWRGIESAPKDGTQILVLAEEQGAYSWYVVDYDDDPIYADYVWRTEDGIGYHRDVPKYWMPLPPPPTRSGMITAAKPE